MNRLHLAAGILLALVTITQCCHGTLIEVVVNPALYASGQITGSLDQYVDDLRMQGYQPILTTSHFSSSSELRNHLAARYESPSGLRGAVFVGDLPVEHFEREPHGGWRYERFPSDLYYMDLDGIWSDRDSDGTYDTHNGNVAPEIYLGRMKVSNLTSLHPGRSEASLLNSYFQKNHDYRQGELQLPPNGLAYIDDDWMRSAENWGRALDVSVFGGVEVISDGDTTTASDYKQRLDPAYSEGYESLLLAAHSWFGGHSFASSSGTSILVSGEVAGFDPQVLFYNLYCCSNGRYTAPGYMAGEYIFGTSHGLLAVGSSKTGSMRVFEDYYDPLGQRKSYGEAYMDWWLARAQGGFSEFEIDWHYGMTLIGDPTLRGQVPEPNCLVGCLLAALCVLGCSRRHNQPM